MKPELTFEVGKHYWTRDKHKATIWLIRPTYMVGEIEGRDDNPYIWDRDGTWKQGCVVHSPDLVAEWREPVRVMVYVDRHSTTGNVVVHSVPCLSSGWELIAKREIVEGEGL